MWAVHSVFLNLLTFIIQLCLPHRTIPVYSKLSLEAHTFSLSDGLLPLPLSIQWSGIVWWWTLTPPAVPMVDSAPVRNTAALVCSTAANTHSELVLSTV